MLASSVFAGELIINTDTSDPVPKAAFQAVINGFKKETSDVTVKWNLFDHEGYKTSIRIFLTADSPDPANWKQLLDGGFLFDNHATYSWQEACAAIWRLKVPS